VFTAWNIQATRTTKDIDLLTGLENSVEAMIFHFILRAES